MRRMLLGLLFILLYTVAVVAVWGYDAIGYAWAAGIIVVTSVRLFWPKRGVQYAYRNWYRLHGFIILSIASGGVLGSIYLLARLLPQDAGDEEVTFMLIVIGVILLIFMVLYSLQLSPPTQRKGWLRRRYPAVAKAIQRYSQPGDVLEMYYPALLIDGERYFHAPYYDPKSGVVHGLLILDEHGSVVEDPELFKKASECKVLALSTIDYDRNQQRARNMEEYRRAMAFWKEVAERFVAARARFAALGPQALEDWGKVVEIEGPGRQVLETTIGMNVLQAEWAARLGLGRLTEVRYEEVEALKAEIHKVRQPLLESLPKLQTMAEPARRLLEAVRRVEGWKQRKLIEPWLMGMIEVGEELKGVERYTYATVTKEERKAWRERTAYALGLDGSERAAEAAA